MHKTTLLVDDKKVDRVKKVLGTRGLRQTVDRALDEVLAYDARRREVERLRMMRGIDLNRPKVMDEAWR